MGKFTVIPQNTFDALQLDAGVLLKRFNPANPVPPADADIICATTGGINPSCVPTFSDMGEDIDNVMNGMKELKHLDGWDCKISTTSLGTSAELIKLSLGCADIDAVNSKITPRAELKQTDFADLWWVGDKADGGLVAVQLKNALSTGGFSLQTTKNGKGQIALELTGHVSLAAQKTVPMVFYSMDGETESNSVTQNLIHVTSSFTGNAVVSGQAFEATLSAEEGYTLGTVVVLMGGEDVTSLYYDNGEVSISAVTGDIIITAVATEV